MKNKLIHNRPASRRALALSLAATLSLAGGLQASTVTETFDNAESAAANGWTGSGNTANNNSYGWSDTNEAGLAGGEAGGIFARTSAFAYFADTNGGTLTRTDTLNMSGKFKLLNDNADGSFRIGFFNTADVPNNFVGIEIVEPDPTAADPFRGYAGVGGTGGAGTGIIPLDQTVTITFDLTWTPADEADGSGTLTGTITVPDPGFPEEDPVITNVNVAVDSGEGTFNAFGLASGGSSNNQNQKTGGCYFDDLTYTAVAPATYTITYDGNTNDSGTVPDPQVKTENQPLTLATNSGNLAKDGLFFGGWNTQADGEGANYPAGGTYTANGNATLYAKWVTPLDLYWDGDGGTDQLWSDVANWSSAAAGGVDPAAIPSEFDTAIFHATSVGANQTIQTRGDRSVQGLQFNSADRTTTIRSNTSTNQNSTLTIGSFGLTRTGNAAVTIAASAANRLVNIALSANQTWQNNVTANNLQIAGFSTGELLTASGGARTLTLSGTYANNTGSRINSRIQDGANAGETLSIVKDGSGTWFISGISFDNTYSGGTTVKNGRLIVTPDGNTRLNPSLLGSGDVTLEGGTIWFRATGTANTTAETITFGNKIVVAGNATIQVERLGSAAANKTIAMDSLSIGANTLTVTGANNYDLSFTGATTLTGNATLNPTTAPLTLAGAIGETGGARSLTKSGSNTLVLSAENTYSGDTTISAGTLTLGASGSISDSSSVSIAAGASLNVTAKSSYAIPALQPLTIGLGATSSGTIVASGLNIDDASVTFTGAPAAEVYVLATYTDLEGDDPAFASVALPSGYQLVYDYEDNKIALVQDAVSGFAAWQSANTTTGGLGDDHDNDGVSNGVEWFLGGNNDTTGFTPLPGVTNTAGTLSVTWVRHPDYPGFPANYGTDFRVETSATLANPWTSATEGVGPGFVEITGNDVKFTFPAGSKDFARLVITGP